MQPAGPYVILPIVGPDGSGKTSLARSLASIAQAVPRDVQLLGGMATVIDVRGASQFHQIIDFANQMTEHSLLPTSGARAAILVVSALESVMPGTRQSISSALRCGIPIIAVALTKCDAVDDVEMLELVTLEVREVLKADGLPGDEIPVIPIGVRSGPQRDDGRSGMTAGPRRLLDAILR